MIEQHDFMKHNTYYILRTCYITSSGARHYSYPVRTLLSSIRFPGNKWWYEQELMTRRTCHSRLGVEETSRTRTRQPLGVYNVLVALLLACTGVGDCIYRLWMILRTSEGFNIYWFKSLQTLTFWVNVKRRCCWTYVSSGVRVLLRFAGSHRLCDGLADRRSRWQFGWTRCWLRLDRCKSDW